jgi:hypothetical protein
LQSGYRYKKFRVALHNVTRAKSSATAGITADNFPIACGVEVVICIRNARKKARKHLHKHAATAS